MSVAYKTGNTLPLDNKNSNNKATKKKQWINASADRSSHKLESKHNNNRIQY